MPEGIFIPSQVSRGIFSAEPGGSGESSLLTVPLRNGGRTFYCGDFPDGVGFFASDIADFAGVAVVTSRHVPRPKPPACVEVPWYYRGGLPSSGPLLGS